MTGFQKVRPVTRVMQGIFRDQACSPGSRSAGLSLLEVVLALAILSVAAAYLAQSMYLAVENAIRSQANTEAELIAESIMNQVVAGFLPAQPVNWTGYASPNPFGSSSQAAGGSQWLYAIQNAPTEVQGMIGIQVSVIQVRPGREMTGQPDLSITRWIIDPNLGLDTPQNPAMPGATSGSAVGGVL
jgi:prepilin-type N-terminal cleavage/methylation domain-containing protein